MDENRVILSVAYNSLLYERNLVKTGGNKKGFVKAQKKLAQPAIDALKAAWRRLYQNNTENVVILNDGLEFQEASSTSIEMQMNENKKSLEPQADEVQPQRRQVLLHSYLVDLHEAVPRILYAQHGFQWEAREAGQEAWRRRAGRAGRRCGRG